MNVTPCIGCAYCCSKVVCSLGAQVYGVKPPCQGLVWDEKKGRHLCKLILDSRGELRTFLMEVLAIGAGCSSSLFNDWRTELRCRVKHDQG